jgi:hypothetical protein
MKEVMLMCVASFRIRKTYQKAAKSELIRKRKNCNMILGSKIGHDASLLANRGRFI